MASDDEVYYRALATDFDTSAEELEALRTKAHDSAVAYIKQKKEELDVVFGYLERGNRVNEDIDHELLKADTYRKAATQARKKARKALKYAEKLRRRDERRNTR